MSGETGELGKILAYVLNNDDSVKGVLMKDSSKNPMNFVDKGFYFKLGNNPNEWKKFFIKFLKEQDDFHKRVLLYAAFFMFNANDFVPSAKPEEYIPFFDDENLADSNMENMQKIIELIWKNSWEKGNWNLDNFGSDDWYKKVIYHEDFKEICKTPIYLPCFYRGILSGEYLLYLLHSDITDDKKFLKFEWANRIVELKENHDNKIRRFFRDKQNNSYKRQFEEILSMSFSKFDEENRSKKNSLLLDLFEWYGYIEYDLYEFAGLPNLLKNVFENPYISGGIFNLYRTGKIKLTKSGQGITLLKTLLFQNTNFNTQVKFGEISDIIFKLRSATEIFISISQQHLIHIMKSEIMQFHHGIEKCDKIVSDYQDWIKEKISDIPNLTDSTSSEIKDNLEELYKFVLLKIILREIQSAKSTYENTFILSSKIFEKYPQVRLYCENNSNEKIDVDNWEDFKEKYSFNLKTFFPEIIEPKKMKEYWLCAVAVLAICFPARLGLVVNKKNFNIPKVISIKWLKEHGVEIGNIFAWEIFSLMCIAISAEEYPVEMKGKDTVFYKKLSEQDDNISESRKRFLFDALRQISKHYLAKNSPDFNEVFAFQVIWWLTEQNSGFTLAKETINTCREFLLSVFTAIENILKFDDLEFCLNNLKNLRSWLNSVNNEMLKKSLKLDFQKICQMLEEKQENECRKFFEELRELNQEFESE